jgi:hypothetical protein
MGAWGHGDMGAWGHGDMGYGDMWQCWGPSECLYESPYVPMSPCPYVPMSLCPYATFANCS